MKTILSTFFLITLISSYSFADIINVPADTISIQGGIDLTVNGDTVLVQPGTYVECINFNGKNIVVGSLTFTTGDTSYISQTYIDGDSSGTVVTFENGEDSTATLCGFTITNGSYNKGGGIHIRHSSPTISYLDVKNNNSSFLLEFSAGGGLYFEYSSSDISNIKVILNNSSWLARGRPGGRGGGIYCIDSDLKLSDIVIRENSGGLEGGGLYSKNTNLVLNNVEIISNVSHIGGGLLCDSTTLVLNNSVINNNSSNYYGFMGAIYSGYGGGAALLNCSSIHINNASITKNYSDIGGAIYCSNSNLELTNVSINNNNAYFTAGIFFDNNSNAIFNPISRCNIYSNYGRSYGDDLKSNCDNIISVVVDTFTVSNPKEVDASPLNKFNFDILNSPTPLYQTLTLNAHATYPSNVSPTENLVVTSDSTVYLAKGGSGLLAYKYHGSSFINTAHINTGNYAKDVAISSNDTVFVADFFEGLVAYKYNDSSFTEICRIDDGGDYRALAISPDGTIFVVTYNRLRAYSFNGSSFTNIANLDIDDAGESIDISSDGTIFLANNDGLRVYKYNGSTIINTAHETEFEAKDVEISTDGTIFVGSPDGIRMYSYDGTSLTLIGKLDEEGITGKSVETSSSGFVFTLNTVFGLCAYNYDSGQITKNAEMNLANCYNDKLAYFSDGVIFRANSDDGIYAYKFSEPTGLRENNINVPLKLSLYQNYPNPFNPSTIISYQLPVTGKVSLTIYNLLGQRVWEKKINRQPAGRHEVNVDMGNHSSGVYFYRIQTGKFVQTKKMVLLK